MKELFVMIKCMLLPLVVCCQHELTQVEYRISFDQRFDQNGTDVRHFKGLLRVFNDVRSDFFMIPEEQKSSTDNSIEISQDTVWRVKANLEDQEMIFDDIFNESLKSRWYYDSLFPMRWNIQPEEQFIDSLLCSKATCSFRGREYAAWFCPALSLPFGPWKAGGLPGLIVKLTDSGHYLDMQAISIRKGNGQIPMALISAKNYADYLSTGNKVRKMLRLSARNTDCADCDTQVKFHSWEKVFEE